MRRPLALLCAALATCAAGATTAAPAAGTARATTGHATTVHDRLTASHTVAGHHVRMRGTVTPATRRRVVLQVRRSGHWVTVRHTRSTRRGAFTLTVPTATPGRSRLRAEAPRTATRRAAAGRARTLTVTSAATSAGALRRSFQVLYLVPSGSSAVRAAPAAIRNDVRRVGDWYAGQTGGPRPRFVRTASGAISVVTARLPATVSAYDASTDQLALVLAGLAAKGWPRAQGEKLVAFLDATSDAAGGYCGITGSGLSLVTEAECDIHPATSDTWPYGATYVTAHEMAHNFGAVPPCAPHYDGTGHVDDDRRDILYSGTQDRDWNDLMLDPGHDDYYDTHRTDCTDIATSAFWTR